MKLPEFNVIFEVFFDDFEDESKIWGKWPRRTLTKVFLKNSLVLLQLRLNY